MLRCGNPSDSKWLAPLTTDALRRGGPLRGETWRIQAIARNTWRSKRVPHHIPGQECTGAAREPARLRSACRRGARNRRSRARMQNKRHLKAGTRHSQGSAMRNVSPQGYLWPGGLGISQQRPIRRQVVVKTTHIQRSPCRCGDHTIRGDFSGFSCRKASISVSGRPPNNLRWNGVHWESIPSPRSQTRGTLVGTDVEAVQSTAHGASPEPSHW
jgi:hypothetical protein